MSENKVQNSSEVNDLDIDESVIKVYMDMDGPLADFIGHWHDRDPRHPNPPEMYEKGFFYNLKPTAGSQKCIRKLLNQKFIDLEILTKPCPVSYISYTEKAEWIANYFPELINKINMTQNKLLFANDRSILVDDDHSGEWERGWKKRNGVFFKFDVSVPESELYNQWEKMSDEIIRVASKMAKFI